MEIPIFPLHTVLCPGIALPLHVFEPRYRLMAARCVETSSPFGIVLIAEGRETGSDDVSIAAVGTFAEIREVGRLPDGRYDLLVVGGGRFAIEDIDVDREPYLVADVTPLDDEVGDADRSRALAARMMRRFIAYLQLLQPLDGETADDIEVQVEIETEPDPDAVAGLERGSRSAGPSQPDEVEPDDDATDDLDEAARRLVIPDDPTVLSYLLSGIIQVDPWRRQQLLEADTTEERLASLDALIDRELWMLRRRLRHYTPDVRDMAARRN